MSHVAQRPVFHWYTAEYGLGVNLVKLVTLGLRSVTTNLCIPRLWFRNNAHCKHFDVSVCEP
jgi:hypothetical protein